MSYVQVEPIVVQIDRLDLVLEENDDPDASRSTSRYNRCSMIGCIFKSCHVVEYM